MAAGGTLRARFRCGNSKTCREVTFHHWIGSCGMKSVSSLSAAIHRRFPDQSKIAKTRVIFWRGFGSYGKNLALMSSTAIHSLPAVIEEGGTVTCLMSRLGERIGMLPARAVAAGRPSLSGFFLVFPLSCRVLSLP